MMSLFRCQYPDGYMAFTVRFKDRKEESDTNAQAVKRSESRLK